MAKDVVAKILGGKSQDISEGADTVADVKRQMGVPNHTASVNGESVDDDYELQDGDYVTLSPAVKGA